MKELPPKDSLELMERFSLSENVFQEIIETLGLNVNFEELHILLNEKKMGQKDAALKNQKINSEIYIILREHDIPDTVKHIYNYTYTSNKGYSYEKHSSNIQCIISENKLVKEVSKGDKCILLLESSIFYPTSGGQISDNGLIDCNGNKFKVTKVEQVEGYVLHYGEVTEGRFSTGKNVELSINKGCRLNASKLHTVHHLLRGAIESIAGNFLIV